jgi:hypothetical protein
MFQQLAIKARACLGQFDPRALAQLVKAFLDLNRKDLVGQSMSHDLSHPKRLRCSFFRQSFIPDLSHIPV